MPKSLGSFLILTFEIKVSVCIPGLPQTCYLSASASQYHDCRSVVLHLTFLLLENVFIHMGVFVGRAVSAGA